MADIELVIKMSQESYNNLKIGCTQRVSDSEMIEALKSGKPLSKGHGDLIDRKELLDAFWTYCREGDFGYHQAEDLIKSALPIIEADKEVKITFELLPKTYSSND